MTSAWLHTAICNYRSLKVYNIDAATPKTENLIHTVTLLQDVCCIMQLNTWHQGNLHDQTHNGNINTPGYTGILHKWNYNIASFKISRLHYQLDMKSCLICLYIKPHPNELPFPQLFTVVASSAYLAAFTCEHSVVDSGRPVSTHQTLQVPVVIAGTIGFRQTWNSKKKKKK